MQFYVKKDETQDGPFDLVSMIRKIRNNEISPESLVLEEKDERAVPAAHHPKLQSFFDELKNDFVNTEENPYLSDGNGLFLALRKGFSFLLHNPIAAIYGGAYMFVAVFVGFFLSSVFPDALSAFFGWITFHFFAGAMALAMRQIDSGASIDFEEIYSKYAPHSKAVFGYSLTIAIISALGGALLVLPGIYILAIYMFAPLLIIEEGYGFWEAMQISQRTIRKGGFALLSIAVGLMLMNFIAASLVLVPLLVTLPITYYIIYDLYGRTTFQR